jgi:DNA-binding CsgD family transcriptional regulator
MKTRGRPPHPDILTPREFEVLELLREGLTNPEIAERMGIGRETVKYHVSEILGKLGMSSRDEAALWRQETHRPWWMAALAPVAWLWRKAGAVAQSPGALAAGAAGLVFGAVVAGLAFIGFLLATGGDGGETEPASLIAATPSETGPLVVTMNEVDGSGANGTATLTAEPGTGILIADAEFPSGLAPGGHPWTVLPGTCATQPFKALGIDAVVPTSIGGAELSGYISSPEQLDAARDGFHYIAVYDPAKDGTVVSCGDIPALSPGEGTQVAERPDFIQLTMNERGGSGVTGSVVLWSRPGGVGVAVTTNAPGWHAYHIHSGSCAAPGPVETFLARQELSPQLPGIDPLVGGTAPASLRDGNHSIDVHAEATGGPSLSCVDIPAGTVADETDPAPSADFVQLSLHEQGGSGVTGDAVLWESRTCCLRNAYDRVYLAADIVAEPDTGALAIEVHSGSCAARIATPIGAPRTLWFYGDWEPPDWFDGDGRAGVDAGKRSYQGNPGIEFYLTLQDGIDALQDSNHYIRVREAAQGGVVACGDIPEAQPGSFAG